LNERPQWRVDWLEELERRSGSETEMHSWRKIRRVDVGRERVQVFNLSVAGDESYVADGIVVHNCTHFSRARDGAPRSADEAVSTIASAGYVTVVSPFLIGQHTNNIPKGVDDAPVPTIPTIARIRLIEPMLAPYYGSGSGETCQSISQPVPTIPTKDRFALVDPLAVS